MKKEKINNYHNESFKISVNKNEKMIITNQCLKKWKRNHNKSASNKS